jgi:hypothetical protein
MDHITLVGRTGRSPSISGRVCSACRWCSSRPISTSPHQNCLHFDPGDGRLVATHADVLREAHNARLVRGAYNMADEHLADAIELPSRKRVPSSKKET